jgi:S-adenosylmethionine hydrolase
MTYDSKPERIALFTDFGGEGLYQGQLELALLASGVELPIVTLLSDAPPFEPCKSACLLAALATQAPPKTLFLAVIDPGVGGERSALVVRAGPCWFVGPDNGLFAAVLKRLKPGEVRVVEWRPQTLSDTFHGRDLFAPIAALLCRGELPDSRILSPDRVVGADWPLDLAEVIYTDHFGNAFTGIRGVTVKEQSGLVVNGRRLDYARTFCEVPLHTPFWYRNSIGLVEIAINQGRADQLLGLRLGDRVEVVG